MDEQKIAREAAEPLYGLAVKYLEGARRKYDSQDESSRRLAIDAAYNAGELCAKAMLRLMTRAIPNTSSGIQILFREKYVKSARVPESLVRDFKAAITYMNKARYDGDAAITAEMVEEVFRFAEQMGSLLKNALEKNSLSPK